MTRLARARHSFGGSNFHLQFTPKYRREIFRSDQVREVVRHAIIEKSKALSIKIGAIEFGPDHLHVFVIGCKNYSAAQLADHLKGYSSYVVRKKCWNIVKQQLWGQHFWSGGYFYESVGRVTSDMVQFYIERQQLKHWQGDDYEYFNVKNKVHVQGQTSLSDFAM